MELVTTRNSENSEHGTYLEANAAQIAQRPQDGRHLGRWSNGLERVGVRDERDSV